MKTKIEVNGLRLKGYHGVFEQENIVGNEFKYSVTLFCDVENGCVNDDLAGTINYAEIVDIIKRENSKTSKLLENVAYRIKLSLEKAYPQLTAGTVKVEKLTPPIPTSVLDSVSVEIDW